MSRSSKTPKLRRSGKAVQARNKAKRLRRVHAKSRRTHRDRPSGSRKPAGAHKRVSRADLLLTEVRRQRDFLEKENAFLRGKCERLELALFSDKGAAGRKYVERTEDEQARPAIGDTPILPAMKTRHQSTREEWDKLSPEQQEKVMLEGNWTPGEEVEVEERKQKHARRH